jgi:hypothetical protein
MMRNHPSSFFMRLPYDIRVIVYTYLEPTALPPLSPTFSNPGFYLSCRQAQQELEDIAQLRLTKYLAHFNSTTETNLNPTTSPNEPRNISVTVPFSTLQKQADRCSYTSYLSWTQKLLFDLHPLLAKHFNTIRIHIGTNNPNDTVPKHTTLTDRGRIEVSIHKLLRDIAYMIDRMNKNPAGNETANVTLATIYPYRHGEVKSFPPRQIKTRRICLSWDLRGDEAGQDVTLNGKLYQSCNLGRESYTAEALARRASAEPVSETDPQEDNLAWLPRTVFYHVRDTERLMGQMCLQSSRRWSLCEEGHFVNETLNAQECTVEYVSCKGLEGKLERGLRRVSEEEFERSEREVEAALWSM